MHEAKHGHISTENPRLVISFRCCDTYHTHVSLSSFACLRAVTTTVHNLYMAAPNPLLAKERQTQSFDVGAMVTLLDGSKKDTFKRRWIYDSHEGKEQGTFDYDGKCPASPVAAEDRDRSLLIGDAIDHFMQIHGKHFEAGYKPKGNDMQNMSDASMMTGPLSVSVGGGYSALCTSSHRPPSNDTARVEVQCSRRYVCGVCARARVFVA